jgi:G3E family GTPase
MRAPRNIRVEPDTSMKPKVPISLIIGALGSGKTTLLRRIIETTKRRVAVLMNEFGEIAVDSRILQGKYLNIVELAGGCVCCELTGELEAAVDELLQKTSPDIIVMEATGVAEGDALVYEVEDNLPQLRLDSVICIVDAYADINYPQIGYASRTQLSSADVVLINKIDLVTAEESEKVQEQVRKYNPLAAVFKTIECGIDTKMLLGINVSVKHSVGVTLPRGNLFQSFSFTTDRFLNLEKFEQVISALPPSVYRAKGFIRLPKNALLFNFVAGRYELEEFPASKTQLVFIGRDLTEDQEDILSNLLKCEA